MPEGKYCGTSHATTKKDLNDFTIHFTSVQLLNQSAAQLWAAMGYQTQLFPLFISLCLTVVLKTNANDGDST